MKEGVAISQLYPKNLQYLLECLLKQHLMVNALVYAVRPVKNPWFLPVVFTFLNKKRISTRWRLSFISCKGPLGSQQRHFGSIHLPFKGQAAWELFTPVGCCFAGFIHCLVLWVWSLPGVSLIPLLKISGAFQFIVSVLGLGLGFFFPKKEVIWWINKIQYLVEKHPVLMCLG